MKSTYEALFGNLEKQTLKYGRARKYYAVSYYQELAAVKFSGAAAPLLGTKTGAPEVWGNKVTGTPTASPEPTEAELDRAAHGLWSDTFDAILVRHPDPKAVITLKMDPWYPDYRKRMPGRFMMKVADTRDPGVTMVNAFQMPVTVTEWPGRRAAELFVVAAWATYLAHEAMELVSFTKGPRDQYPYPDIGRVVNPHQGNYGMAERHWTLMNAIMYSEYPARLGGNAIAGVIESQFAAVGLEALAIGRAKAKEDCRAYAVGKLPQWRAESISSVVVNGTFSTETK